MTRTDARSKTRQVAALLRRYSGAEDSRSPEARQALDQALTLIEELDDGEGVATLAKLARDGVVWFDGVEWVGKASDGVEVSFGAEPDGAALYLIEHPSPLDW